MEKRVALHYLCKRDIRAGLAAVEVYKLRALCLSCNYGSGRSSAALYRVTGGGSLHHLVFRLGHNILDFNALPILQRKLRAISDIARLKRLSLALVILLVWVQLTHPLSFICKEERKFEYSPFASYVRRVLYGLGYNKVAVRPVGILYLRIIRLRLVVRRYVLIHRNLADGIGYLLALIVFIYGVA